MSDEQQERKVGESDDFERLKPAGAEAADLGREARHAEHIEEGAVELRPRGVGEVLDLGLDLVRSRFGLCIALSALVWIPVRWLTILVPAPEMPTGGQPSTEVLIQFGESILWAYITTFTGQMLVVGIVGRILGDAIEGRRAGAGRALQATVTRLPGLLVIVIVTYAPLLIGMITVLGFGFSMPIEMIVLTILFGACVLVVPILFVMWIMTPAPYVYVVEGLGLFAAIRRSARLSCGRVFSWQGFVSFWRWAGVTFVGFALLFPLTSLVAAPEKPEIRAWLLGTLHLSGPALDGLRILVGGLFLAVAASVRAGYLTAWYLDCRVRREGLDLETWLRRIRSDEKGREIGGGEKGGGERDGGEKGGAERAGVPA